MKEFFKNLNIVLHKKQKKQTAVLIVLMIISASLEVCSISTVIPIVSSLLNSDFMYTNSYGVMLCSFFNINTYKSFVITSILILLFIYIFKNVFMIIKNYYHSKFSLEFQYDLRKRVFHKYLNKDYSFYFDNNSSDVYKTLVSDIAYVNGSFNGLLNILTSLIVSLFLAVAVLIIDWQISLTMIIILSLVSFAISGLIKPIIKKNGKISYEASVIRNKWIFQSLQGIKTLKASERASYFENKVYETDLNFSSAEKTYRVYSVIPRMFLELFCIVSFVILISILVLNGNDFGVLIPKISAIGLAFIKLLPGTSSVISNIVSMRYRSISLKRVAELMSEKEVVNKNGEIPDQFSDAIKVSNISFKYSDNSRDILSNASFDIGIGKMVGIVGPSGEGKTTFVDILLGLLPIEHGTITVDGFDIYQNISKWRKSIGYITQDVFLLDDSIKTNVAFGIENTDISNDKIWNVLEEAQLGEFVRSLPDGIETRVGEYGIKLSGGQRQRLGIARALYNNPQILIFDEATSSLDSETEFAVIESINKLHSSHTILIISHRSKALEECDEIYRIKDEKFERIK